MSSGVFVTSKYETTANQTGTTTKMIVPIRVQPETSNCSVNSVTNAAPTGSVNLQVSAVVSRGRRARGIIPRTVTLQQVGSTPVAGYKAGGLTTIPCLTDEFYNECAVAVDSTVVNYLGSTAWRVSYVSPERIK